MDIKESKNLIFDFDGTVADTLAFTINSALEINRKLKLLNDEKIDIEKFRSTDSMKFFKEVQIPKIKLLYFAYRYQRKLINHIDESETFEGLPEVLKELKSRGIKLGIATSNSKKNVRKFLKNNDLEIFDFIYSSIDYFRKDEIILKAVRKYKLDRESTIYVGDEVRDVKAAKDAGIKVASVTWGYNFESILSSYNPDYIVNQPKDLLNFVK
ncbi:HAD-IIIA family hydrolase [Patescibacteria group bacterium]|nr:HAD-IIIA family hydrolase [Patescibacteria group bacterium]